MNEVTTYDIKELTKGKRYNVDSTDVNLLNISFNGALAEINTDEVDHEIVIFKPGTMCEVSIDCSDIVDFIHANEGFSEIIIVFNNGMSDLCLTECENQ